MVGNETADESSSNGYDEVVVPKKMETIDAFSSCVIHMRAERAYTGECINVMTQVLQPRNGSLLQVLTIQNAYTELRQDSKNAVILVQNSTAYPQTLQKKTLVDMVVAVSAVPEPPMETSLREEEDKPETPHTPKID